MDSCLISSCFLSHNLTKRLLIHQVILSINSFNQLVMLSKNHNELVFFCSILFILSIIK